MVLFASNKVQHQPINTQAVDKNRKQDTYLNIMETKMFIINVPGMNLIKKLQIIGYPFPRGIDEIKRAGLTKYKPFVLFKKNIYPCLIKECLAHLECKLIKIINIKKADHFLIIGEVVGASYDSSLGKNLDKIRKNLTQKVFGNLHAISKNKRLIGQIKQIRKTAPVYTSDKFFNKQKKRIDLN